MKWKLLGCLWTWTDCHHKGEKSCVSRRPTKLCLCGCLQAEAERKLVNAAWQWPQTSCKPITEWLAETQNLLFGVSQLEPPVHTRCPIYMAELEEVCKEEWFKVFFWMSNPQLQEVLAWGVSIKTFQIRGKSWQEAQLAEQMSSNLRVSGSIQTLKPHSSAQMCCLTGVQHLPQEG